VLELSASSFMILSFSSAFNSVVLSISGGTLFVLRFWLVVGNISQRLLRCSVVLAGLLHRQGVLNTDILIPCLGLDGWAWLPFQ